MRQEITIGCVSWINTQPNPVYFGASAFVYEPAWVPKTYIGLAATANADPGDRINDFTAFRKSRDFRALIYCRIAFELDEARKRIADFQVLDAVHDPGFTPPFRMRAFPSTFLSFDAKGPQRQLSLDVGIKIPIEEQPNTVNPSSRIRPEFRALRAGR